VKREKKKPFNTAAAVPLSSTWAFTTSKSTSAQVFSLIKRYDLGKRSSCYGRRRSMAT